MERMKVKNKELRILLEMSKKTRHSKNRMKKKITVILQTKDSKTMRENYVMFCYKVFR